MTQTLTFPGFVDVHVHFRDPGLPEAETTSSGLRAAARGGFAAVVTMPNTMPACDSPEIVRYQLARATGPTVLIPSACITKGRLGKEVADLERLADCGIAFFTDDGTFVEDAALMRAAMARAADLNFCICEHALGKGGSEAAAVRRDLALCRETGCRLHIQHLSTAAGVALVRDAVKEGLPVTAEATPHHLLLCQDDIVGDDGNFKMAPPLATREDRAELRKAVKEGLLMFATDHAPHPAARKNVGYARAANGIIGLETAIPITYQVMVEEEGMSVEAWAKAWYELPRALLPAAVRARLAGRRTIVEVGALRAVEVASFASLSRNCPYDGRLFTCWPKEIE